MLIMGLTLTVGNWQIFVSGRGYIQLIMSLIMHFICADDLKQSSKLHTVFVQPFRPVRTIAELQDVG